MYERLVYALIGVGFVAMYFDAAISSGGAFVASGLFAVADAVQKHGK